MSRSHLPPLLANNAAHTSSSTSVHISPSSLGSPSSQGPVSPKSLTIPLLGQSPTCPNHAGWVCQPLILHQPLVVLFGALCAIVFGKEPYQHLLFVKTLRIFLPCRIMLNKCAMQCLFVCHTIEKKTAHTPGNIYSPAIHISLSSH